MREFMFYGGYKTKISAVFEFLEEQFNDPVIVLNYSRMTATFIHKFP